MLEAQRAELSELSELKERAAQSSQLTVAEEWKHKSSKSEVEPANCHISTISMQTRQQPHSTEPRATRSAGLLKLKHVLQPKF